MYTFTSIHAFNASRFGLRRATCMSNGAQSGGGGGGMELPSRKKMEAVAKEVRLALEEAVWFEYYIITAAMLFGIVEAENSPNPDEFLRQKATEPRKIRLREAVDIVARHCPDSRHTLQRGKDLRNRIIHESGSRMGHMYMTTAATETFNLPLPMVPFIEKTASEIKEWGEEMAKIQPESHNCLKKAFLQASESFARIYPRKPQAD